MNNLQLYLAIGAPMLFNAVLAGLLVMYLNARLTPWSGVSKADSLALTGVSTICATSGGQNCTE